MRICVRAMVDEGVGVRDVAFFTSTRADYGHLKSIMQELQRNKRCRLLVIAGGTHFAEEYGMTVRDIEQDGFRIDEAIGFPPDDDDPAGVSASAAETVKGMSLALKRLQPDLLVLLGDRYEVLSAALAATLHTIPIAHVHGGEESAGAIDDSIRHAITKLAHLHFCATEAYSYRVRRLGEPPDRVFTTGAPGLDTLLATPALEEEEFEQRVPGLNIKRPFGLVAFHVETREPGHAAEHCRALLQACTQLGSVLITYPSAEVESAAVRRGIDEFVAHSTNACAVPSLGSSLFAAALRHADVMIGNSSSGIIEAASFSLPVVNVGRRQEGRLRPRNVLDAHSDTESIRRAIYQALDPRFRQSLSGLRNPYGDGKASKRIAEVLVTFPIDALLIKKFPSDAEFIELALRHDLRPSS